MSTLNLEDLVEVSKIVCSRCGSSNTEFQRFVWHEDAKWFETNGSKHVLSICQTCISQMFRACRKDDKLNEAPYVYDKEAE